MHTCIACPRPGTGDKNRPTDHSGAKRFSVLYRWDCVDEVVAAISTNAATWFELDDQ